MLLCSLVETPVGPRAAAEQIRGQQLRNHATCSSRAARQDREPVSALRRLRLYATATRCADPPRSQLCPPDGAGRVKDCMQLSRPWLRTGASNGGGPGNPARWMRVRCAVSPPSWLRRHRMAARLVETPQRALHRGHRMAVQSTEILQRPRRINLDEVAVQVPSMPLHAAITMRAPEKHRWHVVRAQLLLHRLFVDRIRPEKHGWQ